MKQISFCITCMNRLKHLQETLEKNILDNFLVDEVEFVVLDYNSQDGLEEWIAQSMMKYIEMGILVYYRTTEPVHYLRSHSRNMVFRLAKGDVVCNLDADNYLGKGFAEFMLKEFQEKKKIFYISNLCVRDVFGRICLRKQDFIAIEGYNEALVGYGFEDAELFDRLLNKGIKHHVFFQKEFYGAVTHPDEDRISQEAMFKNLQCIYLNYINPCLTEILILYVDGSVGFGIIQDNVTLNCNLVDAPYGVKRCMDERFRITIKHKWEEGTWTDIENEVVLDFKDKRMLFSKNLNGLLSCHQQYYKITDTNLVVKIIMVVTEALNFYRMKEIVDSCKTVNSEGFGWGTAYKNFDYAHQIVLS
ncbi:glycosyltransferase family 2 protein [Bacteroides rodentium]|uniref:glycosyltransferase n=1 Tax=Bacteroides rodentium TaxID=691816 RepID=UPI00046F58E8|nr:glycosyltransferase family A protein [Bacteroides rodentium]